MQTTTFDMCRRFGARGRSVAAFLFGAMMIGGCSDTTPVSPPATSVTMTSGNAQTGVVNTALASPLVATVIGSNGLPIAGATVGFFGGGATVLDTTVTTNSLGQATTMVVLGQTTGAYLITATAVNSAATATFTETATAGAATGLILFSGSGQSAARGTLLVAPFIVTVHDQFGNVVPGVSVGWSATAGTLGSATSVSDVNGLAQMPFTLPAVAGADTVTAALSGTGSTVIFTATGT